MTKSKLSKAALIAVALMFMLASAVAVFAVPLKSVATEVSISYDGQIWIKAAEGETGYGIKKGDEAVFADGAMTDIQSYLNSFTAADKKVAIHLGETVTEEETTTVTAVELAETLTIDSSVTSASFYFFGKATFTNDETAIKSAIEVTGTGAVNLIIEDVELTSKGLVSLPEEYAPSAIVPNTTEARTLIGGANTITMSSGNITINGGFVGSMNGHAINNNGSGNITINGGQVNADNGGNSSIVNAPSYGAIAVRNAATTHGSVGKASYAISNNGSGNIIMNGGIVSADNTGVVVNVLDNNGATKTVNHGGTGSTAFNRAISNNGSGNVTISNGTVRAMLTLSADNYSGTAIHNEGTGKVTITQESGKTTLITSKATNSATTLDGTIFLASGDLEITGGTIENTSTSGTGAKTIFNNGAGNVVITNCTVTAAGIAVRNGGTGTVTVNEDEGKTTSITVTTANNSGGALVATAGTITVNGGLIEHTVEASTASNSRVIYANGGDELGGGNVVINGGKITVSNGNAIQNAGKGTITINGGLIENTGAKTTSANAAHTISNTSSGNITINGGTVKNQGLGAATAATFTISNSSSGAITVNGGLVENTGKLAVSRTINNNGTGSVTISGGTVRANPSAAVAMYAIANTNAGTTNSGTITISGGTVSSNVTDGVIIISNSNGKLNFTGGRIENKAVEGNCNLIVNTIGAAVKFGDTTVAGTVSATSALPTETPVYDGTAKELTSATFTIGSLVAGTDYTLGYSDNINAGFGKRNAVITGSGILSVYFEISKAEQSAIVIGKTTDTHKFGTTYTLPVVTGGGLNGDYRNVVYTILEEGTIGEGEINENILTITKAGTFIIQATALAGINYTVDETSEIFTLTVTKGDGVASVTMADWAYGTTASDPVAVSDTNGITAVTYEYKLKDSEDAYSATKPTNAGEYTVRATFAATTNYNQVVVTADFTINKGTGTATLTMEDWTFGATASDPVVASSTNGITAVTIEYKVKDAAEDYSATKPTNAGEYTVRATFAATSNYNQVVVTADFAITKAAGVATITMEGWTNGETAKDAVVSSSTNTGVTPVIEYKLTSADVSAYSTTKPTAAGNYTVRVTYAETANYQAATATATFTIAEAPEEEGGCACGSIALTGGNIGMFAIVGLIVSFVLAIFVFKKRKANSAK